MDNVHNVSIEEGPRLLETQVGYNSPFTLNYALERKHRDDYNLLWRCDEFKNETSLSLVTADEMKKVFQAENNDVDSFGRVKTVQIYIG